MSFAGRPCWQTAIRAECPGAGPKWACCSFANSTPALSSLVCFLAAGQSFIVLVSNPPMQDGPTCIHASRGCPDQKYIWAVSPGSVNPPSSEWLAWERLAGWRTLVEWAELRCCLPAPKPCTVLPTRDVKKKKVSSMDDAQCNKTAGAVKVHGPSGSRGPAPFLLFVTTCGYCQVILHST